MVTERFQQMRVLIHYFPDEAFYKVSVTKHTPIKFAKQQKRWAKVNFQLEQDIPCSSQEEAANIKEELLSQYQRFSPTILASRDCFRSPTKPRHEETPF